MPEQPGDDDETVDIGVPRNATIILILPYGANGEGFSATTLQHNENDLPEEDKEFFKAMAKGMCVLAVNETKMVIEASQVVEKNDDTPDEQVTAETDLSKTKIKGRA
jgi:hypothetical protein